MRVVKVVHAKEGMYGNFAYEEFVCTRWSEVEERVNIIRYERLRKRNKA